MAQIYSESAMRSYVRDTLEEWLKGYTQPLGDGRQRRIEIVDVDSNWITVRVQRQGTHGGYDRETKTYQIAVEVKEVTRGNQDRTATDPSD